MLFLLGTVIYLTPVHASEFINERANTSERNKCLCTHFLSFKLAICIHEIASKWIHTIDGPTFVYSDDIFAIHLLGRYARIFKRNLYSTCFDTAKYITIYLYQRNGNESAREAC